MSILLHNNVYSKQKCPQINENRNKNCIRKKKKRPNFPLIDKDYSIKITFLRDFKINI